MIGTNVIYRAQVHIPTNNIMHVNSVVDLTRNMEILLLNFILLSNLNGIVDKLKETKN